VQGEKKDRVGLGRVRECFFFFSFSVRTVTDTSGSSKFDQIGRMTRFHIYKVYSLLGNELVPFLPSNRRRGWVLGAEPFCFISPKSRTEHILSMRLLNCVIPNSIGVIYFQKRHELENVNKQKQEKKFNKEDKQKTH
jgi:hypothetical protein